MSEMSAHVTWRAPWGYRLFFGGVGLWFLVGAAATSEGSASIWDGIRSSAPVVVVGLVLIAFGWRPVLRLLDDRIFARGVVFSRTVRLADLKSVEPGYYGLTLVEENGRRFTVPLIGEKANYAAWLGRRTRADSKARILFSAAVTWRREHEA